MPKTRANYRMFVNGTKNADNGAKYRLDSFSGRRRRGYLKFPSLGGPHAGRKDKKAPIGRIPRGR